jgi:hypothetical protein
MNDETRKNLIDILQAAEEIQFEYYIIAVKKFAEGTESNIVLIVL